MLFYIIRLYLFLPQPITVLRFTLQMKNLFCKRLAACLCMKPPKSPSVEPPLIRRIKSNRANGEQFDVSPLSDNDASLTSHQMEDESVQKFLKRICDLMETIVHRGKKHRYEDEKENEMKKDWMLAAAVLDRICGVTFAVIFVGGTIIFNVLFAVRI